jgi:uncharacterized repeat protein (TIGR01451 family)
LSIRRGKLGLALAVALLLPACGGGGGAGDGTTTAAAATTDLSVIATVPAVVTVGQPFTASIAVSNPGAVMAENMVATAILPPGINAIAVRMPGAVCVLGSKVSCRIPSLAGGVTVMEIDGTTTTVGNLSITAEANSTTFDPNTANNAETKTTVVGASTDSIQQAIDNAVSGQTITVDPGTYVGSLTFGGKNITLASRDGPASTKLIQAVGSNAVQMGTGGTLKGFTIIARTAGVQVDGLGGSIISDNIFDPSVWGAPTAIGVYGVNAFSGATIQRNTFRNHSCVSPPFPAGVVMFSSLGNATTYGDIEISDNQFQNNDCPDIALGNLPPSASVSIASNTPSLQPLGLVVVGSNASLSTVGGGSLVTWSTFSPSIDGTVLLTSPSSSLDGKVLIGTLAPGGGSQITVQ